MITLLSLLGFIAFLADGLAGLDFNTLFNTGISSGLLIYFIVKLVPALYDISRSIDRNTRGTMLAVIAFGNTGATEKLQAREIIAEGENAEKLRPQP